MMNRLEHIPFSLLDLSPIVLGGTAALAQIHDHAARLYSFELAARLRHAPTAAARDESTASRRQGRTPSRSS